MKDVKAWIFISTIILIFCSVNDAKAASRNASEHDPDCMPITREIYRLRHWQWSGIFPFEGGFIPDPHFYCTDRATFPPMTQAILPDSPTQFQIIFINPWFHDESQEIVLAIRSGSSLYEYKFGFFQKAPEIHGFVKEYPSVRFFPYKDKIAVLAWLNKNVRGYYFISLPLKSGQYLPLYPPGSPEFVQASQYFQKLPSSKELQEYFSSAEYNGEKVQNEKFVSYFDRYKMDPAIRSKYSDSYKKRTDYEKLWQ